MTTEERQQQVEDVYLRHCYLYYVLACPVVSDYDFDIMCSQWKKEFPNSEILNEWVGSSNPDSYPDHVKEGRRPLFHELRR